MLSIGITHDTTLPVAFNSVQLKGAELKYPVHEKELPAIIRALKHWHSDLLDVPFKVLTDHQNLENFLTQRELSCRQARWQEFLAQYNFSIHYLPGRRIASQVLSLTAHILLHLLAYLQIT